MTIARHVLVQVAALYAAVILSAAFAGRDWMGGVFLAMLVFAVVNPLARALGSAWWAETLLSGLCFALVVPLCQVLDSMGLARLREDAMALLGPLTLYVVVAVPLSGALRYWRYRGSPPR